MSDISSRRKKQEHQYINSDYNYIVRNMWHFSKISEEHLELVHKK